MKRWTVFIFILIIAASMALGADNGDARRGEYRRVLATNLTNDAIKSMEKEIANTKNEKNQIQNSLTHVQDVRRRLVNSRNDLARFIAELDEALIIIEENIVRLLGLIAGKETEIAEKTVELETAIAVQETQYAAMKARVKHMYEQGDTYYLNVLFNTGSVKEMLNRADYVEMLARYDNERLDEYIAYSIYVNLCKESLELEKEYLDEAKAAVEAERVSVNELIDEKTSQINAVMSDISQQERAIREFEADIAAQDALIKAIEKAIAEERARIAAALARRYDGGKFSWPVPSSHRITDEYGERVHPILGITHFHNGIDIAAPTGSAIVAAYGGKVIAADYTAAMGNYIMIDHGDSVLTIYMHASQLYVAEGAEVGKGQRIAAVGSTGRSTGPHLHFSVRVKGAYVSPWGYFGS